ncbi:TauD/TfdA family dioxygenase, partial [Pseudomonas sp. MWU13-2625]
MSFYQDYNDKLAIEGWNTRTVHQYQHLDLRRLSPALGAEIRGVDLGQPLPPAQLEEIRQALTDFLVLTFPGQAI